MTTQDVDMYDCLVAMKYRTRVHVTMACGGPEDGPLPDANMACGLRVRRNDDWQEIGNVIDGAEVTCKNCLRRMKKDGYLR